MTHINRIPTATLPRPVDHSDFGPGCTVSTPREPMRVDQVTIALPKGWRYRWRFADGKESPWTDAPVTRSFTHMPPAAVGMDVEAPWMRGRQPAETAAADGQAAANAGQAARGVRKAADNIERLFNDLDES